MWHTFRGGGPRFVTVCDRGEEGGRKSSKKAWHTLWTAPVQVHVEFTFFGWLTLYFWPLWETVESSTPPRPVPGCRRRSCEFSTIHLENCANARRIHVFWVINPFISDPCGETVEPSTLPRPVPVCRRRFCEVSILYLENCAKARRIHVFRVINPLFLTPVGKR